MRKININPEKVFEGTKKMCALLTLWVTWSIGKRGLKGHFKFAYSKTGHKKIFLLCTLLESFVFLTSIERGDE